MVNKTYQCLCHGKWMTTWLKTVYWKGLFCFLKKETTSVQFNTCYTNAISIAAISITSVTRHINMRSFYIWHTGHNTKCPGNKVAERWQHTHIYCRLLSDSCSKNYVTGNLCYSVVECHPDTNWKGGSNVANFQQAEFDQNWHKDGCFPSPASLAHKDELSLPFSQQIWRHFVPGIDIIYH